MTIEFWATAQMREALASRDMSSIVRAYRCHPAQGRRPIAQAVMSGWLGITQSQLSRIESGRNRVRDLDKLIHYARRLSIPPALLWFDVGCDEEGPASKPVDNAALPDGLVIPVGDVWIEPVLAESLLATLQQYAATDNLAGPRSLLAVVPHQITFIGQLLDGSRGPAHAELLYVAARFAELSGWLNQDAGDLREAMRWSNAALDFAHEADDSHLVSYIQMRKSNIASDANKPELALGFARAALHNGRSLSPQVRAVALRQQAQAHALGGNTDDCSKALQRAYQLAADAPDDGTDIARYCTPSYVDKEAAHCWVELGRPAEAIKTLHQGLAEWRPEFRRDLGLCLARLAVAYASSEQPDHAVVVAQKALTIATDTQSRRTARQLHRVPNLLTMMGANDQAQQLRHELATLR